MIYATSDNTYEDLLNDSPATIELHDKTITKWRCKTENREIEPDTTPASSLEDFKLSEKALKKERQKGKRFDLKVHNIKGAECVKTFTDSENDT